MDNDLPFLTYDEKMEDYFNRYPYNMKNVYGVDFWNQPTNAMVEGHTTRPMRRGSRSRSRTPSFELEYDTQRHRRRIPAFTVPRRENVFNRSYEPRLEDYTLLNAEPFPYQQVPLPPRIPTFEEISAFINKPRRTRNKRSRSPTSKRSRSRRPRLVR